MRHAIASIIRELVGLGSDADLARALRCSGIEPRVARRARVRLPKPVRKGRGS